MHKTTANIGVVTGLALTLGACSTLGMETANSNPEISPVLSKDNAPLNLDGAVAQAQAQRKAGDLTAATRTLSQLVLIAPDDPRVIGEYGKTLVAKGQTDDAIAFLSRALELQSGDWTIFSALGVAYDQRSDFTSAQTAYERALSLKPGEPVTLSNAGLSRMQAGDIENAERLLLQAIESGGDYPRIAQNLALIQSLKRSRAAVPATAPLQPIVVGEAPIQVPEVKATPAEAGPRPATELATTVSAPVPMTQEELPPPHVTAKDTAPGTKIWLMPVPGQSVWNVADPV